MLTPSLVDKLFTVCAFALLVIYHLHLVVIVGRRTRPASLDRFHQLRRRWMHQDNAGKHDALAIQTLRTCILSDSIFAAVAFVLGLALLAAVVRSGSYQKISHALSLTQAPPETLWMLKLLILITVFLIAFFNLSLAAGFGQQVVLRLSPAGEPNSTLDETRLAQLLYRAHLCRALGMRGYYLSIPLVLWLFGSTWLLVGAIILTAALYQLDRTP